MRARVPKGKGESYTRLMVRFPERLHKVISESADERNRSLNYEVITRLRASLELDELMRITDEREALAELARMKRRHLDLRLPGEDDAE